MDVKLKAALSGIRVVELGTYVAAPALGSLLGMLGAEVIKVEPPEGDVTRSVTPWSWINYNWNKKSICIDLKHKDGLKVFRSLIRKADVFIEALAPGAPKRLGIDYISMRKMNRKLLYCSIKGFASDSRSSGRVAFDTVAQAEGALMYATQTEGKPPSRVGNPCVDLTAAAFAAIGILATLFDEPRKSSFIEVPLLDVAIYWTSYWLPYIDISGSQPVNLGSSHPGFSPYGVYKTQDGFIFIGVLTDKQWVNLAERLKIQYSEKLATTRERIEMRSEVDVLLANAISDMETDRILGLLGDQVPCGKVRTIMDLHTDQELMGRGVTRQVNYGDISAMIALPPLGLVRKTVSTLGLPNKGHHTERIMRGLGFSSIEIALMRKNGAIS